VLLEIVEFVMVGLLLLVQKTPPPLVAMLLLNVDPVMVGLLCEQ
jgi:hypothetical protein